jgi:hypothetical protein
VAARSRPICAAPEERSQQKDMKKNRNRETTLSDLIAAAGEVAFECSNSDIEALNVARFALIELLKKTSQPVDLDREFETVDSPSPLVH